MCWPSGPLLRAAEAVFSNETPGTRVEKIMSFTVAEFENGLRRLTGASLRKTPDGAYDLSEAAGGADVYCTFDPKDDAVLSSLMRLPRARVVLDMRPLADAERSEFLLRFEKVFQRGGG